VANKRWVFFESPEAETKFFYCFKGSGVRAIPRVRSACQEILCIEGIQVDMAPRQGKNPANPDPIREAANQACKGALGYLNQELQERLRSRPKEGPVEPPEDFYLL